jgi:tripartite-type tricarboxylate transporter receptor subunit TctC
MQRADALVPGATFVEAGPGNVLTGLARRIVPGVPTLHELGYKDFEAVSWHMVVAPAGTPKPIIALLHREISAIQDMPEVQEQFENRGAFVEKMTSAQFGQFIESEIAKWGKVVKEADIKAQ